MTAFDFLYELQYRALSTVEWCPILIGDGDGRADDFMERLYGAALSHGAMLPHRQYVAIWDCKLSSEAALAATYVDDHGQTIYVYGLD